MAKRPESDYVESVRMHRQAELDDEIAELRAERNRYRAVLEHIAEGWFPTVDGRGVSYELEGDYATDAKYIYPKRERWIRDRARAALEGSDDDRD